MGCDYFVNKGILNFIKGFTFFVLKYKSSAWACQLPECQESPIMELFLTRFWLFSRTIFFSCFVFKVNIYTEPILYKTWICIFNILVNIVFSSQPSPLLSINKLKSRKGKESLSVGFMGSDQNILELGLEKWQMKLMVEMKAREFGRDTMGPMALCNSCTKISGHDGDLGYRQHEDSNVSSFMQWDNQNKWDNQHLIRSIRIWKISLQNTLL